MQLQVQTDTCSSRGAVCWVLGCVLCDREHLLLLSQNHQIVVNPRQTLLSKPCSKGRSFVCTSQEHSQTCRRETKCRLGSYLLPQLSNIAVDVHVNLVLSLMHVWSCHPNYYRGTTKRSSVCSSCWHSAPLQATKGHVVPC